MSEYGHFTTMRVEDDGVRGLPWHAERLRRDAEALFDDPLDLTACRTAALAAVAGEARPVILRIAVTTEPDLGHPGRGPLRVDASTRAPGTDLPALRLGAVAHSRALPTVKHVGIGAELAARRAAQRQGHDDALFVADGEISEGPTWSLLLVAGRRVVTPASPALASVTIALIDELADHGGVERAAVDAADLGLFDAAFAVNAGWGLRPIASIDHAQGRTQLRVGSPVAAGLVAAYAAIERQPLGDLLG